MTGTPTSPLVRVWVLYESMHGTIHRTKTFEVDEDICFDTNPHIHAMSTQKEGKQPLSVFLERLGYETYKMNLIRERALAKLTPEEKAELGLDDE